MMMLTTEAINSTPVIVGDFKEYKILEIRVPLTKEEPTIEPPAKKLKRSAHKNNKVNEQQKKIEIGLSLEIKEWFKEPWRGAFPLCTSICEVLNVFPNGLAAATGVCIKDIICWPKQQTANENREWEAMDLTKFEEKLSLARNENKKEFMFYVARSKISSSVKKTNTTKKISSSVKKTNTTKKKILISKETASKLDGFSTANISKQEEILAQVKEDAKKYYENERESILKELPDSVTKKFYFVGKAKWRKSWPAFPVLVVNPFDIPPECERRVWMDEFQQHKKKDQLNNMKHLVYWYGSKRFSIIAQKDLLDFDKDVEKGKSRSKKRKTEAENLGYQTAQKDLLKSPKERAAAVESEFGDFKEIHDLEAENLGYQTAQNDLLNSPKERAAAVKSEFGDFKEIHDLLTIQDLLNFSKKKKGIEIKVVEVSLVTPVVSLVTPVVSPEKSPGGEMGGGGEMDGGGNKQNLAQTRASADEKSNEASPKLKETVQPSVPSTATTDPNLTDPNKSRKNNASEKMDGGVALNLLATTASTAQSEEKSNEAFSKLKNTVQSTSTTDPNKSMGNNASKKMNGDGGRNEQNLASVSSDKGSDKVEVNVGANSVFEEVRKVVNETNEKKRKLEVEYKDTQEQVEGWFNRLKMLYQFLEISKGKDGNMHTNLLLFDEEINSIQTLVSAVEKELIMALKTDLPDITDFGNTTLYEIDTFLDRRQKLNEKYETCVSRLKEKIDQSKKKCEEANLSWKHLCQGCGSGNEKNIASVSSDKGSDKVEVIGGMVRKVINEIIEKKKNLEVQYKDCKGQVDHWFSWLKKLYQLLETSAGKDANMQTHLLSFDKEINSVQTLVSAVEKEITALETDIPNITDVGKTTVDEVETFLDRQQKLIEKYETCWLELKEKIDQSKKKCEEANLSWKNLCQG